MSSASDSAKARSQCPPPARDVLCIAAVAAKLADGNGRAATQAAIQRTNEYVDVGLGSADATILARTPLTAENPVGARALTPTDEALRRGRAQTSELHLGPRGQECL
jgi:hypothetical protein